MKKEETGVGRKGRLSTLRPVTKVYQSRYCPSVGIQAQKSVGRIGTCMKPTIFNPVKDFSCNQTTTMIQTESHA